MGERLVLEATADFSRLPFSEGTRDVNSDTPNIGEAVVSAPFQDEGLNLRAGVHLHWVLPDALTREGWKARAAPTSLPSRTGGS